MGKWKKWADVDWSLSNAEISTITGRTVKRIQRKRRVPFGYIGRQAPARARTRPSSVRVANLRVDTAIDWSQDSRTIALAAGLSEQTVRRIRREERKPRRDGGPAHPLSAPGVRWELSDSELASFYRRTRRSVARYREYHNKPKAKAKPKPAKQQQPVHPHVQAAKPAVVAKAAVPSPAAKPSKPPCALTPKERLRRAREAWLGY